MLAFTDIYNKAINLFDDPIILKSYMEDSIRWEKMMYPYLENGIARFTNPTKITYLLVDQTSPDGQIDVLNGNGGTTYNTDPDFVPQEGAQFSFMVGGKYDKQASYSDGVVTYSNPVPEDTKCTVEWYIPGCFNTDFGEAASQTTSANVISYKVRDILAHALVLSWAEKEKNFVLDIKNLLNDTDFRLYSPANSVIAKTKWMDSLQHAFDTQTNKLSWDLVSRKYHRGSYYG